MVAIKLDIVYKETSGQGLDESPRHCKVIFNAISISIQQCLEGDLRLVVNPFPVDTFLFQSIYP